MAIFSVSLKSYGSDRGEFATASASYILRERITDTLTGLIFDYSRKKDLAGAFTVLPNGAPDELHHAPTLWNSVMRACCKKNGELRVNANTARALIVALPHELSDSEREHLTQDIAQELVNRHGVACSVGIHRPHDGDPRNYHAHLLFSPNRLGANGWGEKTREFNGPEGQKTTRKIREWVAGLINHHLHRAGHAESVSPDTLEAQALKALDSGELEQSIMLDRVPTRHEGRKSETRAKIQAENTQIRADNQEQERRELERLRALMEETPASAQQTESQPPRAFDEQQREALKRHSRERLASQQEARQNARQRQALDSMEIKLTKARRKLLSLLDDAQEAETKRGEASQALSAWEESHPILTGLARLWPAMATPQHKNLKRRNRRAKWRAQESERKAQAFGNALNRKQQEHEDRREDCKRREDNHRAERIRAVKRQRRERRAPDGSTLLNRAIKKQRENKPAKKQTRTQTSNGRNWRAEP